MKKDCIERGDAINALRNCAKESDMPDEWIKGIECAIDIIKKNIPAVNVPEAVFCSECECNPYMPQSWYESKGYTWCVAMADPLTVPHGYCIFGKRKDESK